MSEAKELLDAAEAKDHYLARCKASPLNRAAREGNIYKPFFLSAEDSQHLTNSVFRVELLNGADIVVLHPHADNGFPHTRPDRIVCVPSVCVNTSSSELSEMLAHEAMHINQRIYPELWKAKCTRDGWKQIAVEEIPKSYVERCRINPDTMNDVPFWAWDTHHVPLPLFKKDKTPDDLGDVTIEWLDLRTLALFHSPPQSFTKQYGSPSQPEHPYEILAVKFSKAGIKTFANLHTALTT